MTSHLMSPDPRRFFDGGSLDDSEPPADTAPRVVLRRVVEPTTRRLLWWHWTAPAELFCLERRIGYRARTPDGGEAVYRVPAGPQFRTDLASVPALFTWLVPRSGTHLPAALVHDALVHDPERDGGPPDYLGPRVPRERADVIFRDAMGDLGTGLLRRWLMWTAVTLPTVWKGVGTTAAEARYFRRAVFGSLGLIVVLGVLATLDLLDWWPAGWWLLPVGDDGGLVTELAWGALMAVVIPVALALLLWRQLKVAGIIAGIALALLFHVTVALAALTSLYLLLEWAVHEREPLVDTAALTATAPS